ncbi:Hypothetical_protein [Hexamita inflata]|uniref:Hypothetical_protein n=1 Tax=Hexamita inflata TaxID=28002 RepID=A0AA86TWA5_9EUKA|nr:Hypothetical protein HINF_LOCUS18854 [Hexamita inflata]
MNCHKQRRLKRSARLILGIAMQLQVNSIHLTLQISAFNPRFSWIQVNQHLERGFGTHCKIIELNDSITKLFCSYQKENACWFILLRCRQRTMLQKYDIYLWYNNKVCMRPYAIDSKQCRARYESGVSATFVGQTNNASNILALRKTFFHMNIALKPKFGAYNQFCARSENNGQFQGTYMTYDTFSQRIYSYGRWNCFFLFTM